MTKSGGTNWPALDAAYADEFGLIDVDVYKAAGNLWRQWGEKFAQMMLKDEAAGLQLMFEAAANVSRVRAAQSEHINRSLPAYLSTTYKRLVLARLERENGHRHFDRQLTEAAPPAKDSAAQNLDRKILVQQLIQRMDEWTRETFDLLILGYSFEDVGRMRGAESNALRSKYHKKLAQLRKQIEEEVDKQE